MIPGYAPGTPVKWNNTEGALLTGIIKRIVYKNKTVEIDNKKLDVQVKGQSPSYVVITAEGHPVVLPHSDVMTDNTIAQK